MEQRYIIRDREAGNYIDSFNTLEEAKEVIAMYEEADKADECYEEDFYEIYDSVKGEIVR